ncbi:unnamed protein product [Calicophoron daubneyi]|uniref:Nuclear pore complex protein Nup155 n=1 Tax=Calicophoron daubneyi TaxID=300641 RepID=A0AAV2TAK0_CALDB
MSAVEDQTSNELSLYERPDEWLNKLINRDGCYRDLLALLEYDNAPAPGRISFSGTREMDYPLTSFHAGGELEVLKSFSLPLDLIEKFAGMQKNCLMGVFTACERAWITVDSELFMWNYEDGGDLAYYDGVKDTIICVGLSRPRPGILPGRVHFLLCLATPLEIVVLGVTYTGSTERSYRDSPDPMLQVIPDPIYCLPTDNYTISHIEATNTGRIFLGTREGSLLELNYSPVSGWSDESLFSLGQTGPCTLINHSASALSMILPTVLTAGFRCADSISELITDPVRRMLYVRTDDSNLSAYTYADKPGGTLSRLAYLSGSDLAAAASNVVRSVDKSQFRSLISVIPLSTGMCYLMAVTKTGIRLYFGENLRLLHIRLPPTSPYGTVGLGEVKLAAETRGTVVLVSALPPNVNLPSSNMGTSLNGRATVGLLSPESFIHNGEPSGDNVDYGVSPHVMYTLSPDPYPWTPNLTEVCTTAWCVGGAWALVVLPSESNISCDIEAYDQQIRSESIVPSADASGVVRGKPPVVLTQHLDPPFRRLLLVSAHGLIHLRLPNPMQRLKEFLMKELSSTQLLNTVMLDPSAQKLRSPGGLFSSAGLDEPTVALNTTFLSAYLHQFSPDEAICAALAVGATNSVAGDVEKIGINLAVEQAVLFFAAEASQFWTPAVKRPSVANPRPQSQQLRTQELRPIDKGTSSGLFLYSGLCVFLARMARTFWRSPLFKDATTVSTKTKQSGRLPGSGGSLRSWMRTFVSTLASASPLGVGKTSQEEEQLIISRLDSNEIAWIIHQIDYLKSFLRRQLTVRGGWLRASSGLLTPAVESMNKPMEATASGDSEQLDAVLLQRLAEELDKLLTVILEILRFWQLLSEHVVHKVIRLLNSEHRGLLLQLPFEAYAASLLGCSSWSPSTPLSSFSGLSPHNSSVASAVPLSTSQSPLVKSSINFGSELMNGLVNAIIEYYLSEIGQDVDSGVTLDSITGRLRAACPNLFANEDAISAKASECLIQVGVLLSSFIPSTGQQNLPLSPDTAAEIDRLVTRALDLYTQAGPAVDLDNAVQRLEAVGAFRGAAVLCLSVAQKRDPTDVAVDCLKNGRRPSADTVIQINEKAFGDKHPQNFHGGSELSATEGRYDAYRHLIMCIEHLWEASHIPSDVTELSPKNSPSSVEDDTERTEAELYEAIPEMVELHLSPSSARKILLSILHDVVKSDDILAHFEILGWVLSHGLTDTAVSLNSPHLEGYIRSRLRQTPEDPDLRCLLWRQLERRGARLEAAQVLEHLAVTPCRQLSLEDRLGFAARAIVAVKALPSTQQDLDYLHDLESRLELGQLQQQLYAELSQLAAQLRQTTTSPTRMRSTTVSPALKDVEDALFQLAHGPLLSLTEMFTDYADKFALHQSKLCLLWASGSQDLALIKAIWRDLLRQILATGSGGRTSLYRSPSLRGPSVEQRDRGGSDNRQLVEIALINCLSRLGQRFAGDTGLSSAKSEAFFPLSDIVSNLEYYAIQHKLSSSWVPTVLRDARLTCTSSITGAYDLLLHSKDPFWRLPEVRTRLFFAFVTLIDDFLSSISIQLPPRQRMLQIGRMIDQVTENLVDLNSESTEVDTEKDHARVIERLRRIHDQLQRFYR